MKTVLIIIPVFVGMFHLLFAFALPCFAELTENDIRRIIREEIEPIKIEIATIKGDIKTLEGKMATKDDIIAVKGDITTMYQKLSDKIDSLYVVMISALVTIIVVIAIPQIIIAYRERRESRLSTEVDELKQEIADLKGKMIIRP